MSSLSQSAYRDQSSNPRLEFLRPENTQRLIVPSSSTAALGTAEGNVDRIASILNPDIQNAVTKLHMNDLEAGAGFIVTATCGAHERQARPDPKAWQRLNSQKSRADQLYQLNRIAVDCAYNARLLLQRDVAIFGSIITSGDCYDGDSQLNASTQVLEEKYRDDHRSQLVSFSHPDQPVDAVLFEAGGVSVLELLAVCQLCEELSLPLLISLVVDDDGDILDPQWKITFSELAERAQDILGQGFLGLGLNCNGRPATTKALEKDEDQRIRMVYPNRSDAGEMERKKEDFSRNATHQEELDYLHSITQARSHICAVGCCCRDERSESLLKDFYEAFSQDSH